jgi:hypothetical protein
MVRKVESEPAVEFEPTDLPRMDLRRVNPKILFAAGAVVALVAAVAIVYLVVSLRQSESARPPVAAAATSSADQPASPTLIKSQQPLVAT